jgi:hypothetical protein
MPDFLKDMFANKSVVIGLSVASVTMFVGTLFAVPWLISRAPKDYFVRDSDAAQSRSLPLAIVRNLVGAVLAILGVLMLLLPGQGILTLIVGLGLLDLPGKRALMLRLAKRPGVMRVLNYVRQKAKREPFEEPRS